MQSAVRRSPALFPDRVVARSVDDSAAAGRAAAVGVVHAELSLSAGARAPHASAARIAAAPRGRRGTVRVQAPEVDHPGPDVAALGGPSSRDAGVLPDVLQ